MLRLHALATILGFGTIFPFVIAQTAPQSSEVGALSWTTGAVVIGLAGAFYRFLTNRITKLEGQVEELRKAADQRAEEDRKLLIPLLSRSVEAQASYLSRRLDQEN